MRCGRITEQHRPQMSLFERANVMMKKLSIGHDFMLRSVIPDLKCLTWYQVAFLFIFGVTVVTFNILDFNKIISKKSDTDDSTLLKYSNDEKAGVEYWRRILMCLSAAAAFTGAMSVVLSTLGKISCLFWGIINCVLYGLYAFAYGFSGDAQLNIVFFLPMQYYGESHCSAWDLICCQVSFIFLAILEH
jgi:Nicotinamide mononucleotide transporter